MNELLKEGDCIKVFLRDRIIFSGVFIEKDNEFIKITDNKTSTPRLLKLNNILNIELMNDDIFI